MTDSEIIMALECCANENKCQECPYGAACLDDKYVSIISKDALDLINRQQAEIEKLNVELVGMRGACESYKMHYDNAQAEIERLNLENLQMVASIKRLTNDVIRSYVEDEWN